ncbi:hypothetical protein RMSM_06248 [Rhodopirellula maiorica SM1]|uniref:Acetyltransferase n=1 Tax=Rhodopirellula maiorica SM1 TaxID=1265738 RepID=M5RBH7_9BACT|nr:hypothetical protein [Rhodopirellula maiorica]EMI16828.1 hypothetical protein RMSM_06248 [Rhodopirellula maiorica SM1]
MFMKEKRSDDLVRIEDLQMLASPLEDSVRGCRQAGEEEQDVAMFRKSDLVFPSGESLPKCWVDADYQVHHSLTHSSHGSPS